MTVTRTTLFFNGRILTMDERDSVSEAMITADGHITAVGRAKDLRAQLCDDAERIDLHGRTMIPAFIDPHGHFPDSGFIELFRVDLSAPPRGNCTDLATALSRLSARAAQTPPGDWVMGALFDNTAIADERMPTRAELDSVSTDHPVWVIHASGHNGVANSMALDRFSLTANTPDPPGGRYDRDPQSNELSGRIEGLSAMGEMGDTGFLIDRNRFWKGFDTARDEYLAHGVTLAQNAWAERELLAHFASLPADRDPGIDLVLLPAEGTDPGHERGFDPPGWPGNPHLMLGPRKLFADGAFQMQTAFLSQPYRQPLNPHAPFGTPYATAQEMTTRVAVLHDKGFQIHCHCNGDAGADLFLDAVEAALDDTPRDDHRHTVIHGQVLRDDQLERMARLGITVSFFSAHIHFWGDRHHDTILGPERAERISPARSAELYGVRYTLHNDASVTPTRPFHLAHCAVNRRTATGRTLGEGQKISVLSALRAQTIDAAWQVFQDDVRGSIEVGKIADFAVLSRDPFEAPEEIADISVIGTVRRGAVVAGTGLFDRP
jgi:hypothetical protein